MARMCWILLALQIIIASGHGSFADKQLRRSKYETQVVFSKWIRFDRGLRGLISSAIKAALPSIMEATSQLNLTAKCMNEGLQFVTAVKKVQMWAFRMIDSSSKSIDGMLAGTFSALGNYEECINTVFRRRNRDDILFRGKYCEVNIHPPESLEEEIVIEDGLGNFSNLSEITLELLKQAPLIENAAISISLCVPSGCTSDDLHQLVQYGANQLSFSANISGCHIKEEYDFHTPAIAAIFLYCVPVCLAIIGTLVDQYSIKRNVQLNHKGFQMLTAFSVPKNYAKLMDASGQSLPCLNGIRFMSILWIMILHNYLFALGGLPYHVNALKYVEFVPELLMQLVFNGTLAVDTFFFLGGLLNCYNRVKAEEKNQSSNALILVRRRLWRIYPGYVFAFLSAFLLRLFASGPIYGKVENLIYKCEETWWHHFLFINNFCSIDMQKMCFGHTWYLACDMQLFLISLITIYPLLKWPRFGVLFNMAVALFFVILSGIWIWTKETLPTILPSMPMETNDFYIPYSKPFFHAFPYFTGMLTGYLIGKKKEMKLSKITQLFGWCSSTAMTLALVLGTQKWNAGVLPNHFRHR